MNVIAQRSRGAAKVSAFQSDNVTRLEDLYQQGCAKVRLPKNYPPKTLEAVMINTAGGMTGGDQLDWEFTARQGACLTVTTQACERIYQSIDARPGNINVTLRAETGSTLCWLPQETILFDRCHVERNISLSMQGDASALIVEPVLFGRKEMGETIRHGAFTDNWQIHHEDKLVHREASCFRGDMENSLSQKAVLDGHHAMATVLLLAPNSNPFPETILPAARDIIGEKGGASFWQVGPTGKLLARLVGKDGYDLRKRLIPLISLLNKDAPLPKSWAN